MITTALHNVTPTDGALTHTNDFITAATAQQLFALLRSELDWHEEYIKIYGKQQLVPRLVCWHGDEQAVYRYSGVDHFPLPWTPTLITLKQKLQQYTGHTFNSVLGNLYRDGKDSMGWHADNEKELGEQPYIASISLGETRLFKARHKNSRQQVKIPLESGSLLVMSGKFQQYWQHCIPKSSRAMGPRINLTFRHIVPAA